jgi:hypothetical protein
LCFAPLRLKRYHFYDDPICDCSIAFGAQFFDVQQARNCFPEISAVEHFIARARRSGGSRISQDYEAGRRSNGADDHFLLSRFSRQSSLSWNPNHASSI